MIAGWSLVPFESALVEKSPGNLKIQTGAYCDAGQLPIVDQGRTLIAGYTDDAAFLNRTETPVVIFGDHTRHFKYIDFPFCVGAEGVKVLRPKDGFDAKYLYYYLSSLSIPNAGYSRHFKYLKVSLILKPPLAEQRRIAKVLDQAEALRAKRREAVALLDDFASSVFLDMFGDPQRNPNNLPVVQLRDVASIGTGSTPDRRTSANFGGYIPWVKTSEVKNGMITMTEEYITDQGRASARCRIYPTGSIVVALYGQGKTRGRSAILGVPATVNQACAVLEPNSRYASKFLFSQLRLSYNRIRALARGGNQENLNLRLVGSFDVILPPLAEQLEFDKRIEDISILRSKHDIGARSLDELFAAVQQRAFRGELSLVSSD